MEKRISSHAYSLLGQKEKKCDDREKGLNGEHAGSEREEDSDADDENAKTGTNQTVSEWKTAFNIMNYVAGSGFIAIPYAVKVAGISALVSLLVMPFILWYTGTILIDCLYSKDHLHGHKVRVYSTYREISEACLPGVGGIVLDIFVFAGLFFVAVGYFVLCGSLLSYALPFVPLSQTTWVVQYHRRRCRANTILGEAWRNCLVECCRHGGISRHCRNSCVLRLKSHLGGTSQLAKRGASVLGHGNNSNRSGNLSLLLRNKPRFDRNGGRHDKSKEVQESLRLVLCHSNGRYGSFRSDPVFSVWPKHSRSHREQSPSRSHSHHRKCSIYH